MIRQTHLMYGPALNEALIAAVHESAHVEGFGCRPIAAMRLAPWPASESLQ